MRLTLIFLALFFPANLFADTSQAQKLVLETRYDEALELLNKQEENTPQYYYLKAICECALFHKDDGIKSARKLLTFENLPERYRYIGLHIEYQLAHTELDGLEHISYKMKDSNRRLNLGQGGPKVQKVQAETIVMLDYLIERIEQQQSGASMSEKCPGQLMPSHRNNSDDPAPDSMITGAKAKGDVNNRKIQNKSGWGSLPPKEQAEAKQYAADKYPPHYHRLIEEYNKRMAERKR